MPKKTTKKASKPLAPKAAAETPVVASTEAPKPVFSKPPAPWESATAPQMSAASMFEQPAPKKAASTAARKATPATPKAVKVAFVLDLSSAERVTVCGDFNSWEPAATPLKRRVGGPWQTSMQLSPGRYQYKFVVDGQWLHDPNARENVMNEHGSLNSVVEVQA